MILLFCKRRVCYTLVRLAMLSGHRNALIFVNGKTYFIMDFCNWSGRFNYLQAIERAARM